MSLLFKCSGCSDHIPANKARIRCQTCPKYELCASCFVTSTANLNHQVTHETVLFTTSGHDLSGMKNLRQPSAAVPNPFARKRTLNAPPPLPRRASQIASPAPPQQQPIYAPAPIPAAYTTPATNSGPSPAQPTMSQPQYQQFQPTTSQPQYQQAQPAASAPYPSTTVNCQQSPVLTHNPYIPSASTYQPAPSATYTLPIHENPSQKSSSTPQPTQQYPQVPQQASSVPSGTPTQWQPLENGGKATPFLESLLTAVFQRVDVNKTSLLSPEQYSAYLDVQQYHLDEDVWKKSRVPRPGFTGEDLADYELRLTYENFGITHTLQTRPSPPPSTLSLSNGLMPMLTLAGFIELTFIELFCDETPLGWQRLNMILRHYGVWREMGDCPREVWPERPNAVLMERVRVLSEGARRRTREILEAKRVEAELKAQGRQNAIDLLDPPGTRYVYQY